MIFPDFSQFSALAKQGNFIPVYQEWAADLENSGFSMVQNFVLVNLIVFYWNQLKGEKI